MNMGFLQFWNIVPVDVAPPPGAVAVLGVGILAVIGFVLVVVVGVSVLVIRAIRKKNTPRD